MRNALRLLTVRPAAPVGLALELLPGFLLIAGGALVLLLNAITH